MTRLRPDYGAVHAVPHDSQAVVLQRPLPAVSIAVRNEGKNTLRGSTAFTHKYPCTAHLDQLPSEDAKSYIPTSLPLNNVVRTAMYDFSVPLMC